MTSNDLCVIFGAQKTSPDQNWIIKSAVWLLTPDQTPETKKNQPKDSMLAEKSANNIKNDYHFNAIRHCKAYG